ncbi:acyl carrier protein [Nocardiopsis alba]|uniref:acyl carrier protein n=1 Tax=Nocardiopsis TaxID=2013 RepID=UPI002DBEAFF3|nr:acyl carrier protein [Nocardiopsis sp. LDBS1602]MEC3894098.1 acyl carrier protein [Nocardiopsis sp. LDBS1602]
MSQRNITIEELVELVSICAGVRTDVATASTSTFEELGVDSLGVLGIIAEIERRVGRKLGPDAELVPSPTALIAFVAEGDAVTADGV